MRTKIVYVLVSTDKDFYLEQAYVSMYSAKYYMPDAHIALLVDRLTEESFVGKRKEMLKYVDELVVVDLDMNLPGKKRSRLLKTSFRQHINGNLLFIDCDTIIVKPLYEIDDHKNDIESCRDLHSSLQMNPVRDSIIQRDMRLLKYKYSNDEPYYNSGVIFVKDNEITHQFFHHWHKNYLKGYEKGVCMDQPSYSITNLEMNHIIKNLDDCWNCQIQHGLKYLNIAKVVHYLGQKQTNKKRIPFYIMNDQRTLERIKSNALIDDDLKKIITDPFWGISSRVMCVSGCDVDFLHSSIIALLNGIYYNCRTFFDTLNAISYCALRLLLIKKKAINNSNISINSPDKRGGGNS